MEVKSVDLAARRLAGGQFSVYLGAARTHMPLSSISDNNNLV